MEPASLASQVASLRLCHLDSPKLSYRSTDLVPTERRTGEILLGTLLSPAHFYSARPFWENPALGFISLV